MTPLNNDPTSDQRDLVKCLNQRQAEYIIVGAYALAGAGIVRGSEDFDLLINPTPENAARVAAAVKDFIGVDVDAGQLAKEKQRVVLGQEPNQVDILTTITGVSWERAWRERVQGRIKDQPTAFLSPACLIANKSESGKRAGREQDLLDVKKLLMAEQVRQKQKERGFER